MVVSPSAGPCHNESSRQDFRLSWSEPGLQFVFVLEPGFTMHAFSSAVEVLRLAGKLGNEAAPSWHVASIGNQPVPASNGISIQTNRDIDDLPRRANIVVVSGAGVHDCENCSLLGRMRRWDRQGHRIWAISSGVVRLAQAGLVNDSMVAAHWEDIPYLNENYPRVSVSNSLFISNSKHPTCAGGAAAADLMLDFIARELSPKMVEEIVSRLVIATVRNGRANQLLPVQVRYASENGTVLAALKLMERNIHTAITVGEIAHNAGKSQRQLERLFDLEFGKTPGQVYRELRLGAARQSVIAGRRPLKDIAWDFGFEPTHFAQVYRRAFGVLPSIDRSDRNSSVSQTPARNDEKSGSLFCALT